MSDKTPLRTCRIAIFGFGSVGVALVKMIQEKNEQLQQEEGIKFVVIAVQTRRRGGRKNSEGLNLTELLASKELGPTDAPPISIEDLSKPPYSIDILVECIPVNYKTAEPAITMARQALSNNVHFVTANKGPVVHGYSELTKLAKAHNRKFLFESAVMDGVPIFNMAKHCLRGATITGFRGVLNSTSNLILTEMETGSTFADALEKGRQAGCVEEDPSGDIDGWDAAVKVAALSTVLMNKPIDLEAIPKDSISNITPSDIDVAKQSNQRYKVLCHGPPEPRVTLQKVDSSSPFYNLPEASSAVEIFTDVLEPIMIKSTNPGISDTAFGCLTDCLEAMR
eukprot:TRINITY_DN9416_c1_g1_i1.p1 TRINITY_DN9416_c1_g1~~TRINITY_DN9416_c1_g1_i1.p1  ORF type:complete len:358 (+),score=68.33 TRINITY_DN9416_c1_g1_i1:63-1076(+)